MNSALLFRIGGLGDLLVTLPSIQYIRKKYPSCSLTLVCRKEYGSILKETGVVDEIVSVDQSKISKLFLDPPSPDSELVHWMSGFDLILGWMQKTQSLKLEEFYRSDLQKKCRLIIHDPICNDSISLFFFKKTVDFLGQDGNSNPEFNECVFLPISDELKEKGQDFLDESNQKSTVKFIVIHPGSGNKNKCWPLENFMEIIKRSSLEGLRGILVTGPAEERIVNNLENRPLPPGWKWLYNPSLIKLTGLLSSAALYLGNDSGVTHLAASCGTKVVALFRKDLESLWKPNGYVTLLSGHTLSQINLDSVWQAISGAILGVSP